jgi:predicted Zn-dependent protease
MQQAVASPEPETLAASARSMLAAGRPAAARPLIAALARMGPESVALVELGSAVAAADGDLKRAIVILDQGIGVTPRDVLLRKRRAGLRQRMGDLAGALADAAEAVIAAPSDAAAKALLGLLLIEAGEIARARVCLAEAVATEPDNATFRIGLAEAAGRAGDAEAARIVLDEGIARAPGCVDLRVAAIRLALGRGDGEAAQGIAEVARREGVANAVVLRMLAQAAAARGRDEDAAAALTAAWKLDPTDPGLRHFAAAAGLLPPAGCVDEVAREPAGDAAGHEAGR